MLRLLHLIYYHIDSLITSLCLLPLSLRGLASQSHSWSLLAYCKLCKPGSLWAGLQSFPNSVAAGKLYTNSRVAQTHCSQDSGNAKIGVGYQKHWSDMSLTHFLEQAGLDFRSSVGDHTVVGKETNFFLPSWPDPWLVHRMQQTLGHCWPYIMCRSKG